MGGMLQEKQPSRPEKGVAREGEAPIEVGRSPTRCPYCHADCSPDEPRVAVCQRCLSRHHSGCWREGGDRCASCGAGRALAPSPQAVSVAPADLELLRRGLVQQAVAQVAARQRVSEAEAMEALLHAAGRLLADSRQGLPPWAIVMIVAVSLTLLIPILAILVR